MSTPTISPISTPRDIDTTRYLEYKISRNIQHHVSELLRYLGEYCPDDLYDILTGTCKISVSLLENNSAYGDPEDRSVLNFNYLPTDSEMDQFVHLMSGHGGRWGEKLFPESVPWFPSCMPKDIYCYLLYIGRSEGISEKTWKTIDQIDKYWYYHLSSLAFERPEIYSSILREFKNRVEEWRDSRLTAEQHALKILGLPTTTKHDERSFINSFHLYKNSGFYRGFPVPSNWTLSRRSFKNRIDKAISEGNLASLEEIVDYEYIQQSFPQGLPSHGKLSEGSFRIVQYYIEGKLRELNLYLSGINLPDVEHGKKKRPEGIEIPGAQTIHSFSGQQPSYPIPEDLNQMLTADVKLLSVLMAYPHSDPMSLVNQGVTEQILAKRNAALRYSSSDFSKPPFYCLQLPNVEDQDPNFRYVSILPQNSVGRRGKARNRRITIEDAHVVSSIIDECPLDSRVNIPENIRKDLQEPDFKAVDKEYVDMSYLDRDIDVCSVNQRVESITGITEHGSLHTYCRPPMWKVMINEPDRPTHYVKDEVFTGSYDPTDFSCMYEEDSSPSEFVELTEVITSRRKQLCMELNQLLHAVSLTYKVGDYRECEIFSNELQNLDDLNLLEAVQSGKVRIPNYLDGKYNSDVTLPGFNSIVPHKYVNHNVPTFQLLNPVQRHEQLEKISHYKKCVSYEMDTICEKRRKYTSKIYNHGLQHWTLGFVGLNDMIHLFSQVNKLDQAILGCIARDMTEDQQNLDDIPSDFVNVYSHFWDDSEGSSDEEIEEENEIQDIVPWVPQDADISHIPHISQRLLSYSAGVSIPTPSSVHTPTSVQSPVVTSCHNERNQNLQVVCGTLAVQISDIYLYEQIMQKLKSETNRKVIRSVTKSMKYVIVYDYQSGIPLYRAYENGVAVLYDAIYPSPNQNFLWISEQERLRGEKPDAKLSLQKCKKIAGLYYPKMTGEFVLMEMNDRLSKEMAPERLYAYKLICELREPGVQYDSTIDKAMTELSVNKPENTDEPIMEPEYVYTKGTCLLSAMVVFNDIIPCMNVYKHCRLESQMIPMLDNNSSGISCPGKSNVCFPFEYNGYNVRLPTHKEELDMNKKWNENASLLDSVRQMHYVCVQTMGTPYLNSLNIHDVNWEYVEAHFQGKKSASNIFGAIYSDLLNEHQKQLYSSTTVNITDDMLRSYGESLPGNYTQYPSGVPANLSEYIRQQKKILSSKNTEAAQTFITSMSIDNRKHKDYIETDSERVLKEAKKREIAKKRRQHTVIAPGPTADGYYCSISGLRLQSDPYVMCSSTRYIPAGVLSDVDIPVSPTETFNPGRWTDISSPAYIPGILERNSHIIPLYGGYTCRDVHVPSDEELLAGKRSYHRKSIYPNICQLLIDAGWIHPCERMIDRDDGLLFVTEEDIYIAFHGDYDLKIPDPKYLLYICNPEELPVYYRSKFDVDIHRPRSHLLSEFPSFCYRTKKISNARQEYLKRYAINCFLHKLQYVMTLLSAIRMDSLRLAMMGVQYTRCNGQTICAYYKSVQRVVNNANTIYTEKPSIPYGYTDTPMINKIYREVTATTPSGIVTHYISMVHGVRQEVAALEYESPLVYTFAGQIMFDIWYAQDITPEMYYIICKLPLATDKCLHLFAREYFRLTSVVSPLERYRIFLYYYKKMGDYFAEINIRIPGQTEEERKIELVVDAAIIYCLRIIYPMELNAINECQEPSTIRHRNYIVTPEEEYVREILDKKRGCRKSGVKFSLGMCVSNLAQIERSKQRRGEFRGQHERKLEYQQQLENSQVNYYRKNLIMLLKDRTMFDVICKNMKTTASNIDELIEDLYERISDCMPDHLPRSSWKEYYGYSPQFIERIYQRYLSECIHKEDVVMCHELLTKLVDINELELMELDNSVHASSYNFTCPLTDNLKNLPQLKLEKPTSPISHPYELLITKATGKLSEFSRYIGEFRLFQSASPQKFNRNMWKAVLASSASAEVVFHVYPSNDEKVHIHLYHGKALYLVPIEVIRHLPISMYRPFPSEVINYAVIEEDDVISNSPVAIIERSDSESEEEDEGEHFQMINLKPRISRLKQGMISEIEISPAEIPTPLFPEAPSISRMDFENDVNMLKMSKNWNAIVCPNILKSVNENAGSDYINCTIHDPIKWDGTYLGKFPKAVIRSDNKEEGFSIVELLLPLMDREKSLHHYRIICLMFNVKTRLSTLLDEASPQFGLRKIGTHSLNIGSSMKVIYRLEYTRCLTLTGLKTMDYNTFTPEFLESLERVLIYQNFCGHPLEGKYIMISNNYPCAILPKCMSEVRRTDLKFLISEETYLDKVKKMTSHIPSDMNILSYLEKMAERIAPECLPMIPELVSNIRRSTTNIQ